MLIIAYYLYAYIHYYLLCNLIIIIYYRYCTAILLCNITADTVQ